MDEENPDNRPKRRRVLRALDVIPPFGKSVPPAQEEPKVELPSQRISPTTNPVSVSAVPPQRSRQSGDAGSSSTPAGTGERAQAGSADATEIPAYDLAENILAEQRRTAGRRRRAPGRASEKPVALPQGAGIRVFLPEPASQDLLELQQIVAQIVARDIERLCKRPERPPFAVSA